MTVAPLDQASIGGKVSHYEIKRLRSFLETADERVVSLWEDVSDILGAGHSAIVSCPVSRWSTWTLWIEDGVMLGHVDGGNDNQSWSHAVDAPLPMLESAASLAREVSKSKNAGWDEYGYIAKAGSLS